MDQTSDVRCNGEAIGPSIDLDWGEIGNYGTGSEVGNYLLNRDETCDCEEIRD